MFEALDEEEHDGYVRGKRRYRLALFSLRYEGKERAREGTCEGRVDFVEKGAGDTILEAK